MGTSFDPAGCDFHGPHGQSTRERYLPGCFDASILRGGQLLRLNHQEVIRGRFVHIREDGGELRFAFELHDTPLGRGILRDVRAVAIRHCSVAYQVVSAAFRNKVDEISEANLTEISVLRGLRPSWYGSSVFEVR